MNNTAEIIDFTTYAKPSNNLAEQSTSQIKLELPDLNDVTGGSDDSQVLKFHDLIIKLSEVFQYARNADWDGEGADPVTDAVLFNTIKLFSVMPLDDLPLPEILPDNDGFLELEWYDAASGKNCSLYVTDSNLMLFAAYYDEEERLSGRFNYSGEFPHRVKQLIKDVYAES